MNRKTQTHIRLLRPARMVMLLFILLTAMQPAAANQDTPKKDEPPKTEDIEKPETEKDPVTREVITMTKYLHLDEAQVQIVTKALKMEYNQAKVDRQTFKGVPLGLVNAAQLRRNMVDSRIRDILKPRQQAVFAQKQRKNPTQWELFMLTEGLVLSREQIRNIEALLIRYEGLLQEALKYGPAEDSSLPMTQGVSGAMPGGGDVSRRNILSGDYGLSRTQAHSQRRQQRSPVTQYREEKETAIKKLLDKNQKKMYKQLKAEINRQMKMRIEQLQRGAGRRRGAGKRR